MDKILGRVEATVLRSHSLGRVIDMHVEIITFPSIHSFIPLFFSSKYLCAGQTRE